MRKGGAGGGCDWGGAGGGGAEKIRLEITQSTMSKDVFQLNVEERIVLFEVGSVAPLRLQHVCGSAPPKYLWHLANTQTVIRSMAKG